MRFCSTHGKIEFQIECGKGMWAASFEEGRCKAKMNFKLNFPDPPDHDTVVNAAGSADILSSLCRRVACP